MNKIRKIISGFSENTINMSEGFIAKLQKQASNNLTSFIEDIKYYCYFFTFYDIMYVIERRVIQYA